MLCTVQNSDCHLRNPQRHRWAGKLEYLKQVWPEHRGPEPGFANDVRVEGSFQAPDRWPSRFHVWPKRQPHRTQFRTDLLDPPIPRIPSKAISATCLRQDTNRLHLNNCHISAHLSTPPIWPPQLGSRASASCSEIIESGLLDYLFSLALRPPQWTFPSQHRPTRAHRFRRLLRLCRLWLDSTRLLPCQFLVWIVALYGPHEGLQSSAPSLGGAEKDCCVGWKMMELPGGLDKGQRTMEEPQSAALPYLDSTGHAQPGWPNSLIGQPRHALRRTNLSRPCAFPSHLPS